jgi:hypothetical protein
MTVVSVRSHNSAMCIQDDRVLTPEAIKAFQRRTSAPFEESLTLLT